MERPCVAALPPQKLGRGRRAPRLPGLCFSFASAHNPGVAPLVSASALGTAPRRAQPTSRFARSFASRPLPHGASWGAALWLLAACSNGPSGPADAQGSSSGVPSSPDGERAPAAAAPAPRASRSEEAPPAAAGVEGTPASPDSAGEGAPEVSGPPALEGEDAPSSAAEAGSAESGSSEEAAPAAPAEGEATGADVAEPVNHVFLLLGQSNMAGYASAQASDRTEDPRITVLGFDDCQETGRRADEWDIAAPPLHECWNGAVGPGDWFAKTLLAALPEQDTIGLVPCALSGRAVEVFMQGPGTEFDWIVGRARAAQAAGGVIEGMLFHQGESNCTDPNWPGKVQTLVRDLRAELGLGDVPFLAGELPYAGNCSAHNSLVARLPELIPNAGVVSAQGLAVDPADTQWNLHFGHDETVELGRRYATSMIEALGL